MTASLSRMMANIGAPRPCVKRLLLRTAESIMLYGTEYGRMLCDTKSIASICPLYSGDGLFE